MSSLNLKNINKIYDNKVQAVFNFDLDIKDKEFIVFVGPSGCGKSTTLRMIAGLEDITSGELYIDNRLVNNVDAADRDIAMVFQNYALYPHMTVYENMVFALKLRNSTMPVFEEDESLLPLIEEKRNTTKEMIKVHYKWVAKKDDKELEKQFFDLFNKFKEQISKIASLRKQKVGRYESRIKILDKEILKNEKEIARLSKLNVKANDVDKVKIENEISTREKENVLYKTEKEHLLTNDVPLFVERKMTKEEILEKVFISSEVLDLLPYLRRKPKALSGGQRQRVALGRAIVRNPKVFLMDEPLSNLDAKLRVQTRTEILRLTRDLGATTVYVTHDQTEAMTMADRIVVMKDGYIQQIDTPENIYENPENTFVGGFIGNPAMNFINGRVEKSSFVAEKDSEKFVLKLNAKKKQLLKEYEGKEVILGIRTENIFLESSPEAGDFSEPFKLKCEISELLGNDLIVYSKIAGQRANVKVNAKTKIQADDVNSYKIDLNAVHFFDKDSGIRIK